MYETTVRIPNSCVHRIWFIYPDISGTMPRIFTESANLGKFVYDGTFWCKCNKRLLFPTSWAKMCACVSFQRPVGLMAVVMQAFYTLLKHIEGPLLPQMSVHKPVCQVNKSVCERSPWGLLERTQTLAKGSRGNVEMEASQGLTGQTGSAGTLSSEHLFDKPRTAVANLCMRRNTQGLAS